MVLTVYLNFLWESYFSKSLFPLVFEIDEFMFFYKINQNFRCVIISILTTIGGNKL
jgi:hypothetical protein